MERAAFAQQTPPGGGVDGAVDAAAAQEGFVGCVDDGVDGEGGDVGADERDFVVEGLGRGVGGAGGGGGQLVKLVEEGEGGDFGERDGFGGHSEGA